MGRAGRKRQGKCFMIMTESESKKFEQAKESYARVQSLISQGTYLSYYKSNPSIMPANYKPTICRKELAIGRYEYSELKKKRRTPSSSMSAAPSVNADGLMNATTERQFLQDLSDDINLFTNLTQAMSRYWPYKPGMGSLSKHIPLQTKAKSTYRVANSNRTTRFINLVENMENRILYPDQETKPTLPTLTPIKTQTTLKMPSKASSTLKIPVRKKHKTQAEAKDDDFADFMEQNDVSHFLHNEPDEDIQSPELNPRRVILEDFFAPKRKGKARAVQKSSPSPVLHNSVEDMSVDDILPLPARSEGSKSMDVDPTDLFDLPSPSNGGELRLTDSINDVDMSDPPAKTSRDKGKGKMTAIEEMSLLVDDDFGSTMDDEGMIGDPFLPQNFFEDVVPFENKPVSATELKLAKHKKLVDDSKSPVKDTMDVDAGDIDFGESLLDDMILEAENRALADRSAKGFDDELPPQFPFEKEAIDKETDNITFIWTQTTPKFSDEALKLLEKRQENLKELTGKFVAMNIIARFKIKDQPVTAERRKQSPILICTQSPLKQALNFSQDFDDDFAFESGFMEEAVAIEQNLQQNQKSKQAPVLKNPPIEIIEEDPEEEEVQIDEEGFAGFSEIDFDELSFTNMIENKLSDDEPGFYHFMPEEENHTYASQQASQMKERQSLYSFSSPRRDISFDGNAVAVNTIKSPVASVPEEVYEIDFDDTPTPPSVIVAADEEVVYEYDFTNSSDEDKNETRYKDAMTTSPANEETRLTSQRKAINLTQDKQDLVKSPIAEKIQYNNTTPLRENSKDTMQYSPNKLLQMSKGLAPPLAFSPINYSPLRNTFAEDSDDSISMPVRQRKRRVIEVSPMDEDQEEELRPYPGRKKRLKRKSSTPLSTATNEDRSVIELSNDEEDDEDHLVFAPPSKNMLLQRLQQCKEDDPQRNKKQRKIIQNIDDLAGNPFMDVEAEKSSDEGHTSDEDREGGSSLLNSFIDDESLDPESQISVEDEEIDQDLNDGIQKKKKKVNMYVQSMMNDDAVTNNSKHWMNRFDANKWLNAGDDSIIDDDAGSDEEEGEEDPESVTEFSSHIGPFHEDPVYNIDDEEDDDFM